MAMLGVVTTSSTEMERSQVRQHQLLEIMADAVNGVLQRPDSRRGPYVISDSDLRRPLKPVDK